MLPALIFDLDGTLWDACKPIGEAWTLIGKKYFGPDYFVSEELAKSQMGKTMEVIGENLCLGPIDPENKQKFVAEAFAYENEYLKDHPGVLFDNELEVLCRLKEEGYPLYIVSNCQAGYIENFLPLAPSLFIDHMCWSDTEAPKAVTIKKLMERNGITQAIYIGDTEGDEIASRGANIPFLQADYGFGTAVNPDGIAINFSAIPEQVRKICAKFGMEVSPIESAKVKEMLASKYLTSSQIEMLRLKVEDLKEEELKSARIGVVVLADSFIRDNGTADPEYEAFYNYFQSLISINSDHFHYDQSVMMVMPLVFLLSFFQYLVLLGVYSEKDMASMSQPFASFGMPGANNPTA